MSALIRIRMNLVITAIRMSSNKESRIENENSINHSNPFLTHHNADCLFCIWLTIAHLPFRPAAAFLPNIVIVIVVALCRAVAPEWS